MRTFDQSGRFYTLRKGTTETPLGASNVYSVNVYGLWGRIEPLEAAEYPEGERVDAVRFFKVALPYGTDILAKDQLGMQQGSSIVSPPPGSNDLIFNVAGIKSPGSGLPTCVIAYVSLEL